MKVDGTSLIEYATRLAERFVGKIKWYTPLNEPRVTAWYCGQLGWWPPYLRGDQGFAKADRKILIDVANPLDFSKGMPPTLSVCNTDSLGEQIQRAFPGAKVVKTLNTVNSNVMVDPSLVDGGDHHVFVSGNDEGAKAEVTRILKEWFGWKNVLDLGDITSARGAEMLLSLWLRLSMTLQTPMATIKVVS